MLRGERPKASLSALISSVILFLLNLGMLLSTLYALVSGMVHTYVVSAVWIVTFVVVVLLNATISSNSPKFTREVRNQVAILKVINFFVVLIAAALSLLTAISGTAFVEDPEGDGAVLEPLSVRFLAKSIFMLSTVSFLISMVYGWHFVVRFGDSMAKMQ